MKTKRQCRLTFKDTDEVLLFNSIVDIAKHIGVTKAYIQRIFKSGKVTNAKGRPIFVESYRVKVQTKDDDARDALEGLLDLGLIRPVPDLIGIYITEDGKTVLSKRYSETFGKYLYKLRSLLPNKYTGYCRIACQDEDGKVFNHYVHRAVAFAWIPNPNPEEWTDINHKDGNKENNSADNLEWCTKQYNMLHGVYELNNNMVKKGESRPGKVPIIDQNGVVYKSYAEASKILGIKYSAICFYMIGRRKTAGGYTFTKVEETI